MTYRTTTTTAARFIEFSLSSSQTISTGSIIKFDSTSKRTTGGDSVSYNSTTGVLTLSSTKRYWVQAAVHCERSTRDPYNLYWVTDSSTTEIQPSNGGFEAYILSGDGTVKTSSSHVASLMVDSPSTGFRLYVGLVPSNSTITTRSSLFIVEADP